MTTTQHQSAIGSPGPARLAGRPTREGLRMIERTRGARDLLSSKWKVDLLYLLVRGARRYTVAAAVSSRPVPPQPSPGAAHSRS
jgi:hypothetical protein